jgi:hypothetical protein
MPRTTQNLVNLLETTGFDRTMMNVNVNGVMRKPLSVRNGGNRSYSSLPPPTPTKEDLTTESPASVVTVPLSDASTPRTLRSVSTVAMGDSGAEVTLDLSALNMNTENETPRHLSFSEWGTPKKARESFRPMNALFDSGDTPSPVRQDLRKKQAPGIHPSELPSNTYEESTPSPQFLTDTMCCASKCWKTDTSSSPDQDPMMHVQGKIAVLLTSPVSVDSWCNGWQAWSYVEYGSDNQETPPGDLKTSIQRGLRNRVVDMNARKQRLATLRKDLNPFVQTPPKQRQGLVKAKSFNIVDHAPAIARYSTQERSNLPSIWESVSCTALPPDADSTEDFSLGFSNSFQEDAGYDSDPEDFIRRGNTKKTVAGNNDLDDTSEAAESSMFRPEDAVIVRELMNEKLTLILHPSTGSTMAAPHAVSVWIEPGRRMCNELVSPKFVWKSAHKSSRKVAYQRSEVSSVDILDIHRILQVEKLNRSRHPFAKTANTFLIKTIHDETLLFEASSTSERDRLVHSFKLMVARLGSMLVVQDDTVLEEFFVGVAPSPHFLGS